jgi:hypothetical protein
MSHCTSAPVNAASQNAIGDDSNGVVPMLTLQPTLTYSGAVAGCVGNGRGSLRRGDGIASGGEVNHALGRRLTEALPAIHLAHADLA